MNDRGTKKRLLSAGLILVMSIGFGLTACQPAPAAPAEATQPAEAAPAAEGAPKEAPTEAPVAQAPAAEKPAEEDAQQPAVANPASVNFPLTETGKPRQDGDLLISDRERQTAPTVDVQDEATLVDDNTNFLFDLYPEIQPKGKNFFFSPYSISLAMAMLYGGARGTTADQIADVMHFTLPAEKLFPAFNAVSLDLLKHSGTDQNAKLNLANSLWGQKNQPFLQSYLDLLAENFGAGIYTVDFSGQPEEVHNQINAWVNKETEEKIPEIIPAGTITPLTRMILADAIYFKAAWEQPFDPALSDRGYFFLISGGQTMASMMTQTGDYSFSQSARYDAVEVPYAEGGLSLVVIMPTVKEFENVEKEMNTEFIKKVESELKPARLTLTMPRIAMETGYSLTDPLVNLGILNAFASLYANFSGIDGTRDLYLEEISHKAVLQIDEAGTEAAAATAAGASTTSVEEPGMVMEINHPYLFFIRDRETNAILFFGRVLNPNEKVED